MILQNRAGKEMRYITALFKKAIDNSDLFKTNPDLTKAWNPLQIPKINPSLSNNA